MDYPGLAIGWSGILHMARESASRIATRLDGGGEERAVVQEPGKSGNKIVVARGVHKRFGRLEVLRGIDIEVASGEVLVMIGPSGSGKTTFLRCINFLEEYQEGRIYVDGKLVGYNDNGGRLTRQSESQLARLRADVAMVFQSFNLFPHMTALANVALGPIEVRGLSKAEAHDRATRVLKRVGLADKLNSYPSRLSGGQQQRVAIARALAMQPQVILFDEVTSALDPELVGEVLAVMRELAEEHGVTMIIVTHEMQFAREVADHIVFMDAGIVVEYGTPGEMIGSPKTERLRNFLRGFSR